MTEIDFYGITWQLFLGVKDTWSSTDRVKKVKMVATIAQ